MEPLLKDYNAFITGAGSAISFARHGAAGLAIADINEEALNEVVASIGKEFPRLKILPLLIDVTDASQVKSGIARTVKEFGRLDVAVNNAGVLGKNQLTHTLPEEEWRRVLDVNINSVFYCHKEELRIMKKQEDLGPRRGRGTIINTASIAGLRGVMIPLYQSAYVTTKHAVVGLTRADAISYSPYNIRINAICPGYVETPMVVTDTPGIEQGLKLLTDNVPLNRLVLPEEIADGIVFLASQMSSAMQGSTLTADLGLTSNSGAGLISKI
ncbi:hypothetical protein NLG97_g701 [Lecanicillium saksenae]|uniref:Uncharacterized protein n=1 Tax=Lecanicillium saksenae TaxID=468837 RepID=A0ACC1R8F6_9HYPO|nr:hypothetical protein NLG97_g701 [Lecanicillium saksenae]